MSYLLKYHLDSWTDAIYHLGAGVFLHKLSCFIISYFLLSLCLTLGNWPVLFFQPSVAAQSALCVSGCSFCVILLIIRDNSEESNKSSIFLYHCFGVWIPDLKLCFNQYHYFVFCSSKTQTP